jgi:hypothetical protein
MSKLTDFDIEFFELTNIIKKSITELDKQLINKKLLKLNNPTYFSKFVKKHPIENHGFTSSKTINPILCAVANMLHFIKTESNLSDLQRKLQIEMSWAYNNYNKYSNVNV